MYENYISNIKNPSIFACLSSFFFVKNIFLTTFVVFYLCLHIRFMSFGIIVYVCIFLFHIRFYTKTLFIMKFIWSKGKKAHFIIFSIRKQKKRKKEVNIWTYENDENGKNEWKKNRQKHIFNVKSLKIVFTNSKFS